MMGLMGFTGQALGVTTMMAEGLRYLHAAFTAGNVRFLLMRTACGRPGLAVDARDRAVASAMLDGARGLGFSRAQVEPGVVRVATAGAESSADGIDVEFWDGGEWDSGGSVRCPRPNALTRMVFDPADIEQASIRFLGLDWPTVSGMFDSHAHDVDFDIDIVFSWVDGSDPMVRARRAALLTHAVVGEGDDTDARIRQIDELRYALRSVYHYAPWVRRIFVATDSPAPPWLADHPRVTIVPAVDHFSDTGALPTFNSHAVESQLHHIDGLSEHFLYSNDDMFFARPVWPSMFFTPAGVSRFIESDLRIGVGKNTVARSGFENAARRNRALLAARFGHVITRHLEHAPVPLRRSVLCELEREFPGEFARTRDNRFRSASDISVTNSLYHYYALFTGRAVPHESARVRYVDTTHAEGLAALERLRTVRDVDFFCLNDSSDADIDEATRQEAVSAFLSDYYLYPAPWERVSAPAHRPDDADPSERPVSSGLAQQESGAA